MNLREIVDREEHSVITQEEAIYLVEQYMKVRKNEDVDIRIETRLPQIFVQDQLEKLVSAAVIAGGWFRNQNEDQ